MPKDDKAETYADVQALAREAGVHEVGGHMGTLKVWENSPEGKEFKDTEKDREKAEKDAIKRIREQEKESVEAFERYENAVTEEAVSEIAGDTASENKDEDVSVSHRDAHKAAAHDDKK